MTLNEVSGTGSSLPLPVSAGIISFRFVHLHVGLTTIWRSAWCHERKRRKLFLFFPPSYSWLPSTISELNICFECELSLVFAPLVQVKACKIPETGEFCGSPDCSLPLQSHAWCLCYYWTHYGLQNMLSLMAIFVIMIKEKWGCVPRCRTFMKVKRFQVCTVHMHVCGLLYGRNINALVHSLDSSLCNTLHMAWMQPERGVWFRKHHLEIVYCDAELHSKCIYSCF